MNDKPVNEMTDDELRQVIAELRGWVGISENDFGISVGYFHGGPFPIPNWPQDTHAALVDLLTEMKGYWLQYFDKAWNVLSHEGIYAPIGTHPHPARAICEVWVLWKKGQA